MNELIKLVHAMSRVGGETDRAVDVHFFKVTPVISQQTATNVGRLKDLIQRNRRGEFCEVDLFDGREHSYIELGAWIGDQGLAMKLMGLGASLGFWKLLTPRGVFGGLITDAQAEQMAGQGLISIKAKKEIV